VRLRRALGVSRSSAAGQLIAAPLACLASSPERAWRPSALCTADGKRLQAGVQRSCLTRDELVQRVPLLGLRVGYVPVRNRRSENELRGV
jgi:hypothetical protein